MASVFAHAVAALALGAAFTPPARRADSVPPDRPRQIWRAEIPRWWLLGVVCAVLPDLDVVSFSFNIGYAEPLGHRGFTHSILFAAIVAAVFAAFAFPRDKWRASPTTLFAYFFLCGVSHGVLDAMTNEGLGVAFFSPFTMSRYFFPWRPIQVSPIGIGAFLSADGLAVIRSELQWVALPAVAFVVMVRLLKDARA